MSSSASTSTALPVPPPSSSIPSLVASTGTRTSLWVEQHSVAIWRAVQQLGAAAPDGSAVVCGVAWTAVSLLRHVLADVGPWQRQLASLDPQGAAYKFAVVELLEAAPAEASPRRLTAKRRRDEDVAQGAEAVLGAAKTGSSKRSKRGDGDSEKKSGSPERSKSDGPSEWDEDGLLDTDDEDVQLGDRRDEDDGQDDGARGGEVEPSGGDGKDRKVAARTECARSVLKASGRRKSVRVTESALYIAGQLSGVQARLPMLLCLTMMRPLAVLVVVRQLGWSTELFCGKKRSPNIKAEFAFLGCGLGAQRGQDPDGAVVVWPKAGKLDCLGPKKTAPPLRYAWLARRQHLDWRGGLLLRLAVELDGGLEWRRDLSRFQKSFVKEHGVAQRAWVQSWNAVVTLDPKLRCRFRPGTRGAVVAQPARLSDLRHTFLLREEEIRVAGDGGLSPAPRPFLVGDSVGAYDGKAAGHATTREEQADALAYLKRHDLLCAGMAWFERHCSEQGVSASVDAEDAVQSSSSSSSSSSLEMPSSSEEKKSPDRPSSSGPALASGALVRGPEHEHSVKEEEATDADDDEEDDKHADRVSGCLDALSQLAVPREARCRFTTLSCADSSRNPHILYCGDCKTELVDVSRASDTVMLGARSGGGSAISKFYRKHVFGLHLIDTRDGCRYVKELQTGTSTYARRGCVRLIPRGCFLDVARRHGGLSPRHCEAALAVDMSTTWPPGDRQKGRQMPPLLLPELRDPPSGFPQPSAKTENRNAEQESACEQAESPPSAN